MRKWFPKNIGFTGRLFRGAIALALLIYAYTAQSWLALAASIFVFFEAFMSWCVVYHFLGINRCPVKKKK